MSNSQASSTNWLKLQAALKRERKGSAGPSARVSSSGRGKKRDAVSTTAGVRKRQKRLIQRRPQQSGNLELAMSDRRLETRSLSDAAGLRSEPRLDSNLTSRSSDSQLRSRARQGVSNAESNEGNSTSSFGGKYVALDCEMVGIGPPPHDISQLARVSLVNYHGDQIYDSYVLPKVPVTDYRTAVSGITPQLLRTGRPFDEVKQDIATILSGRILVGHALKNDLAVLQLFHPRESIRDTSHHRPFKEAYSSGGIPSLRLLAREVLGLDDFQKNSHDSVEDARVAMLLYRHDKGNFENKASHRGSQSRKSSVPNVDQHKTLASMSPHTQPLVKHRKAKTPRR